MKLRRDIASHTGYALVSFSLVAWLASAGLGFGFQTLASYSILAIGAGVLLIGIGMLRGGSRENRSRTGYMVCPACGWEGTVETWEEYEGCPRCDNQAGSRTWIH